ncbi:hypothetical protein [Achromobacter phage ehaak_LB5]|nr:hypothetical protein [Achromobacter phage ehaak_LB5]
MRTSSDMDMDMEMPPTGTFFRVELQFLLTILTIVVKR